jgi:TATA-binding protein-associated factor
LAVIKSLYTFITVPDFERSDWMHAQVFSLLFQNLVLEERDDIRQLTFNAFVAAVTEVESEAGALDVTVEVSLEEWYEMIMTPVGAPLDVKLFAKATSESGSARTMSHNVDKATMAGDLSLVPVDTMLQTRIAGAKALAMLRRYQMTDVSECVRERAMS